MSTLSIALRVGSILSCASLVFGCAAGGTIEAELEGTHGWSEPIIGGTPATEYPESALVDMYQGGQLRAACSGALIAPRVVLTAGHCVYGFDGWRVTLPFANGQTAAASSGVTYDWKVTSETVNPSVHDVGLVFLDQPLALSTYPQIATSPLANGSQVVNIGRIDDGQFSSSSLFVSPPVQVTDGAQSGYPFDYAAVNKIQSGDSGGPDMLAGTHTIVAVNSGAGGGLEVLARVDLLATWIAQHVAAHGGGGGGTDDDPDDGDDGGGSTGPVEAEPNNTYQQANALGAPTTGNLTGGDRDWFTWSISGATSYDVELDASADAQIRMWKLVGGKYYSVPNSTPTSSTHTASGPGKYFVAVHSPTGKTQSYTLAVTK